jgi:membrane protein implicated in regulation of membrane protease activity
MTPHMKWGIAAFIIGLILFIWNPIAAVIVLALAIAVPVTLYRMLSPEQRRRLRQQRNRKQIGG